jgi:hypothetical protein
MAKTTATKASVEDFLNGVGNEKRRADAFAVLKLMQSVTRQKPKMWGASIVGFDQYEYQYANGKPGTICMIGFSPRSAALTLYLSPDFAGAEGLLKKLGKHTRSQSGGCVHIRKLEDVDLDALKELVAQSYLAMKAKHGSSSSG